MTSPDGERTTAGEHHAGDVRSVTGGGAATGDQSGGARSVTGGGAAVDLPAPPDDAATVKACCAQLWASPAVRLLVGDAFRPGGAALTGRLLDEVGPLAGARVLDVGCGAGTSLRLLAGRGAAPVGVDYSPALATEAAAAAPALAGDAERLPLRAGAFDGALLECVLSALPDKPAALAEVHRVLVPGGWLLLTDVTVTDALPAPLGALLSWVACTAGALAAEDYVHLLAGAGLRVETVEDHQDSLAALVSRARRRLALLQGAAGTGILADGLEQVPGLALPVGADLLALAQDALGQVAGAVGAGQLSYVAMLARRDAPPSR